VSKTVPRYCKCEKTIAGKADAAGIGIPASIISVWYRSIPVPDSPAFRHLKKLHKGTGAVGVAK
jgi:hypothetical protein